MMTRARPPTNSAAPITTRSSVDVPSPYHGTPTRDVLAALEHYRHLYAGIAADLAAVPDSWDYPEQTLDFVRFHIAEATAELERRDRLRGRPEAPPWPTHRSATRIDFEGIKRRLPVTAWLEGRGIAIEKRGSRWWARCPFPDHEDRTPSFSISPCGQLGCATAASAEATSLLCTCSSMGWRIIAKQSRIWKLMPGSSRCWRPGKWRS